MEDVQLAEIRRELAEINKKLDELLHDSRRARPFLEKYLNSPIANWAVKTKRGVSR